MSKGVQQENSAHSRITKWWIVLACAIVMLVLLFLSGTLGRADRAAVEKGRQEITRAQYEAAFQNYQSCMIKIGHPIQGVTEVGMVYQFLIPKAAEDEGGEACYEQEFQDADVAWQTQDFVAEQSQAAQLLRACLERYELPPGKNQEERSAALVQDGHELSECLSEPAPK